MNRRSLSERNCRQAPADFRKRRIYIRSIAYDKTPIYETYSLSKETLSQNKPQILNISDFIRPEERSLREKIDLELKTFRQKSLLDFGQPSKRSITPMPKQDIYAKIDGIINKSEFSAKSHINAVQTAKDSLKQIFIEYKKPHGHSNLSSFDGRFSERKYKIELIDKDSKNEDITNKSLSAYIKMPEIETQKRTDCIKTSIRIANDKIPQEKQVFPTITKIFDSIEGRLALLKLEGCDTFSLRNKIKQENDYLSQNHAEKLNKILRDFKNRIGKIENDLLEDELLTQENELKAKKNIASVIKDEINLKIQVSDLSERVSKLEIGLFGSVRLDLQAHEENIEES